MIRCRNCSSINGDSAKFCVHCGFNMWQKPQIYDKPFSDNSIASDLLFGGMERKKTRYARYTIAIILGAILSFSAFLFAINTFYSEENIISGSAVLEERYRICPDAWIKSKNDEYFVLNKQKERISEFDIPWVEKNCGLKQIEIQ